MASNLVHTAITRGAASRLVKRDLMLANTVLDKAAADTRTTVKSGGNVLGQNQSVTPGTTIGKNAKGAAGMLGFGLSLASQTDPKKFKAAGLQKKDGNIIFPNRITTKNNNKLGSG